jgi:flagellar protein FlbD
MFVNCDLLKFAEASPDTVLTLITGEKVVVRETCEQVIAQAMGYRARLLGAAWPDSAEALGALLTRVALDEAGRHGDSTARIESEGE